MGRKRKKQMTLYVVFGRTVYGDCDFHGAFSSERLANENVELNNKSYGYDACFVVTVGLNEFYY